MISRDGCSHTLPHYEIIFENILQEDLRALLLKPGSFLQMIVIHRWRFIFGGGRIFCVSSALGIHESLSPECLFIVLLHPCLVSPIYHVFCNPRLWPGVVWRGESWFAECGEFSQNFLFGLSIWAIFWGGFAGVRRCGWSLGFVTSMWGLLMMKFLCKERLLGLSNLHQQFVFRSLAKMVLIIARSWYVDRSEAALWVTIWFSYRNFQVLPFSWELVVQ